MIKKTIEGVDYYCFEESDHQIKKEFEKALISDDTLEKLVSALFKAVSEIEIQKINSWNSIRKLLASSHSELSESSDYRYDWILGGFVEISEKGS